MYRGKKSVQLTNTDDARTNTWSESAQFLINNILPRRDENKNVTADDLLIDRQNQLQFMRSRSCLRVSSLKEPRDLMASGPHISISRRCNPGNDCRALQKCLTEGYFPAAWIEGNIIVLLKKPGPDPQYPNSFRPVTQLSVLGKAFDRILLRGLQQIMTQFATQLGFTARSTGCTLQPNFEDQEKRHDSEGKFDIERQPIIHMVGARISVVQEVKYLGI